MPGGGSGPGSGSGSGSGVAHEPPHEYGHPTRAVITVPPALPLSLLQKLVPYVRLYPEQVMPGSNGDTVRQALLSSETWQVQLRPQHQCAVVRPCCSTSRKVPSARAAQPRIRCQGLARAPFRSRACPKQHPPYCYRYTYDTCTYRYYSRTVGTVLA